MLCYANEYVLMNIWASTQDYVTYRIGEQQKLK